jgi:hypothetical protein
MKPDHALHTRPKTPTCTTPDSPVYAAHTPHAPISQSTQHLRAASPSISDPTVARPRHARAIDPIDPAQTPRRPRHRAISAASTCTREVIDTTAGGRGAAASRAGYARRARRGGRGVGGKRVREGGVFIYAALGSVWLLDSWLGMGGWDTRDDVGGVVAPPTRDCGVRKQRWGGWLREILVMRG